MSSASAAATCLSEDQTRQMIDQGKAQHLASIKASVRSVVRGDVIKARLCQYDQRLAYQLTLLSRTGAVSRLVVDATSGKVIIKGRF